MIQINEGKGDEKRKVEKSRRKRKEVFERIDLKI
jgi:hypothetical protein